MKKIRVCAVLLAAILLGVNSHAQKVEDLNRGFIGMKAKGGIFLSWRLLATDNENIAFNVYRDDKLLTAQPLATVTNYTDTDGTASSKYSLEILPEHEKVELDSVWSSNSLIINLETPTHASADGEYTPNDITVGDVDGDGEYELILKWDPRNSKDNSHPGATSNVIIDCIKLSGQRLWRIDLGRNIRAGAHYTQMACFDFDGNGKAELMLKTAPGTIDGSGAYVSEAATDEAIRNADNTQVNVNQRGDILVGPEWLTVFDGETGKAVHTVFYCPSRDQQYDTSLEGSRYTPDWGDGYGNRGERYLCAVAHLGDDANASAIFSRGYYTQAFVWAVDFDGKELKTRWIHESRDKNTYSVLGPDGEWQKFTSESNTANRENGSNTLYSNGNHNLSIGDVDGDGYDEIIYGSAALDHDGRLLYATGYGHGDAIHLSDLLPDRPGLEVFQVHEEHLSAELGSWDLHDAATGEILLHGGNANVDNGRGIAAQLSANDREFYFASADDRMMRRCTTGEVVNEELHIASINFRIYWTGTLQDDLLNGNTIVAFNGERFNLIDRLIGNSCNFSKRTPNFSGDILGDWREEVILWESDAQHEHRLLIYSTTIPTDYRVVTLPHDHVYRMGMAWQNVAYNQPPHLGFFLPDLFNGK